MRADIGYERTLGVHDFSAIGAFRYTKNEMTGMTQDFKDANISLRLNYSYDKRYLAELWGPTNLIKTIVFSFLRL